jgi:hypothetical protein
MRKIAIVNGWPQWPGDDPEFIAQRLAKLPALTITALVKELGHEPRTPTEQPTAAYFRVRAALHVAMKLGRVRKFGRLWGVVPKEAKAS